VQFDTFTELRASGEAFVESHPDTAVFDLAPLRECNSAAVALLMAWYRFAHARGKTIVYTHAAPDLVNLIRVSGLEEILPLSHDEHH
jgi:ABC-type transporter Mla MlaB component